jgi:hypothetical protein
MNRVLSKMLGTKWDDVPEGGKKLCLKQLHDLYSSVCINRVIKSCRIKCIHKRNTHMALAGKPERKILLGRQV